MRKGVKFGIVICLVLIFISVFLFKGTHLFSAITGKATSGTVALNITIVAEEESPPANPSSGGSGGGGGGASITAEVIRDIDVNKERIIVTLKQGETANEEIVITNKEKEKVKVDLEVEKIKDLIKLSEENFELNPGESKKIIVDFIARKDAIPELYIGKIIITIDKFEREILTAIEIESEEALFDVNILIPSEFLTVSSGENLVANIRLFEVEEVGKVDVEVEYKIVNEINKAIYYNKETIAVEGKINFIKSFIIPEDVEAGEYILYVKISYDEKIASANSLFLVKESKYAKIETNFFLLLIILFFVIVIFLVLSYFILKYHRLEKKMSYLETSKKTSGKLNKLREISK